MRVRVIQSAYCTVRFFLCAIFLFALFGGAAALAQQKPAPATKDPVEQHYQAAETFQLTGDFQKAEAEYRRTASLALQRLAAIRALAQDQRQAIELLQTAVNADATDLDAQMNLAAAQFQAGDLTNARLTLEAVLTKDDRRPGAKSLQGKILFLEGDYATQASSFALPSRTTPM